MQLNNIPTLNELFEVFPLKFPSPFRLTDSYGDAISETLPFSGLQWNEVDCDLIKNHWEAPSFFSPEAFHYYLPAYIICSKDIDDMLSLPLENIINTLEWWDERWDIFTKVQLEIVLKWIAWLKANSEANTLDKLGLERSYDALLGKINK